MEFKVFGIPIRLEIVLVSMVLGFILALGLLRRCSNIEGLMNLSPASMDYKMMSGVHDKSWTAWSDVFQQGHPADSGDEILAQNKAPSPAGQLEQGQLFMWAANKFSPECCPSIYSSADGCACASPEQMQFLNQRGGNRTLPTIF